MTIKALLFDKDGCLFDFQRTWGAWAARLIGELAADEAQAWELATALEFDLEQQEFMPQSVAVAGTPDQIADIIIAQLPGRDRDALIKFILETATGATAHEVVPLPPLMARFRAKGLLLGLATNDGEAVGRAQLSTAGILDQFAFVAGFDSGFGAKPDPGMQNAFLSALELTPQEAAMIGDSTHDMAAGRAAGMVTVGVLTGTATRGDLATLADVILPDIGHLPDWLNAA